MMLVDTSVWIDHLRHSDKELAKLLNAGSVLIHPFVIGEIALGTLQNRDRILDSLNDLPHANMATDEEVHIYIKDQKIFGMGIGYVDAHLLAAVKLTPGCSLWTRDKRLHAVSLSLKVATQFEH